MEKLRGYKTTSSCSLLLCKSVTSFMVFCNIFSVSNERTLVIKVSNRSASSDVQSGNQGG